MEVLGEWPGGCENGVLRAACTRTPFSGEYPPPGVQRPAPPSATPTDTTAVPSGLIFWCIEKHTEYRTTFHRMRIGSQDPIALFSSYTAVSILSLHQNLLSCIIYLVTLLEFVVEWWYIFIKP